MIFFNGKQEKESNTFSPLLAHGFWRHVWKIGSELPLITFRMKENDREIKSDVMPKHESKGPPTLHIYIQDSSYVKSSKLGN